MGMVNLLAKFTPDLTNLNEPLKQVLPEDIQWVWDEPHIPAFREIKKLVTSTPVLAHFDTRKDTIIAADASANGIGGVLMQKQNDGRRHQASYPDL